VRRWRLGLCLLCAAPACGEPAAAPAGDSAADWQRRLNGIVSSLHASEWAAAETAARALGDEMSRMIVSGDGAARSVALVTALRAVAEAGQGRGDEAVWDWQVAQQLAPELEGMDLRPFGAAGAALAGRTPRADCAGAAVATAAVDKPRVRERGAPVFPDALRQAGVRGAVTVEGILGADGVPRQPRLRSPDAPPTMALAAAEAFRQTRFHPARRAGQPVPYCYAMTVRFELVEPVKR